MADVGATVTTPPEHAVRWRPGPLTLRFASGIVAVPFLLGTAYFGGWFYGLVITAATVLAGLELRGMLKAAGYAPLVAVLIGLAAFLPFDAWFLSTGSWQGAPDGLLATIVVLMVSLLLVLLRRSSDRAMLDWALSLALALYIGGLMQFLEGLIMAVGD